MFFFGWGDFWIDNLTDFNYLVSLIIESSLFVRNDSSSDIFYSYLKICSFSDALVDFFLHSLARFLASYKDLSLPVPTDIFDESP